MALLQCQRFPYLKITVREPDGKRGYRRFDGGRLSIDGEDGAFDQVMAFAAGQPYITIHEDLFTCPACGEQFSGIKARGLLEIHVADSHPGTALDPATKPERIRAKAGTQFACDVCIPAQAFPDEAALRAHVALLHAARPELNDNDEAPETFEPQVRQGIVTTVPAARKTGKTGKTEKKG